MTAPAQTADAGTTVARIEPRRVPDRYDPHADVHFGDLMALAKELVPTGFLPEHIKTPGQAAAVILTGRELGMGPMRALRSLQMVKGKVVENADSQLARFKTDGGRAVFKTHSDTEAVLWLRHPNGDEHIESFTIEDARRANLGDMYKKYPKAMLRSRVITAGLKSVGWEGGAGNYDPEEAAASFAPQLGEASPAGKVSAREGRRPAPSPSAASSTPTGSGAEAREDTGEAASEKQVTFLGKLLQSSVWTQEERVAYAQRGEASTRQQMTALLDEVVTEGKARKAKAAAEPDVRARRVQPEVVDLSKRPKPTGDLPADPYVEPGDAHEGEIP